MNSKTDKYRPDFGTLVGTSQNGRFFQGITESEFKQEVYGVKHEASALNNIKESVQNSRHFNKQDSQKIIDGNDSQTLRTSFQSQKEFYDPVTNRYTKRDKETDPGCTEGQ